MKTILWVNGTIMTMGESIAECLAEYNLIDPYGEGAMDLTAE